MFDLSNGTKNHLEFSWDYPFKNWLKGTVKYRKYLWHGLFPDEISGQIFYWVSGPLPSKAWQSLNNKYKFFAHIRTFSVKCFGKNLFKSRLTAFNEDV
jgi:hypothetical protein